MALSANAALDTRNDSSKTRHSAIILTGQKIYRHALVVLTAAGKAKVAANETTTTFFGLAEEECDTGDGTVRVNALRNLEIKVSLKTSVTVGMTAKSKMYAFDDAQVTNLATLGPEIGTLNEFVAANSGWVRLMNELRVVAS